MTAPSYITRPQIVPLQQLLKDIRGGDVAVPRFQRPFVWSDEQRLELLRSVREGIPIGAILMWRTRTELKTYPRLGPHLLSAPPAGQIRSYILDGHQRLATLYGALQEIDTSPPEPPDDGGFTDDLEWRMYFDLREDDFRLGDRGIKDWWIPLSILLDGKRVRQFLRRLEREWLAAVGDEGRDHAEREIDEWNERADTLAVAFASYSIPVMPFATEDLDVAVRTFERVNTQGTPMSEVHIVAALSWSREFDFAERVADVLESLRDCGWGDLDEKLVLQVCKDTLGVDVAKKASADAVKRGLKENPGVFDDVERSLRTSAAFLRERCQIHGPAVLPYSLQFVLLAHVFRTTPRAPDLDGRLERWLWATTLGEYFAGMNSARLARAIEHIEQLRDGQASHPPDLATKIRPIERFDFRSARSRGYVTWFASAYQPRRADGTRVEDPHSLIAEYGKDSVPKLLLPKELGKGRAEDGPENRIIVHPRHARALRRTLTRNPGALSREVLESHAIDPKAGEALAAGEWQGFLRLRRETVRSLERARVTELGLEYDDGE